MLQAGQRPVAEVYSFCGERPTNMGGWLSVNGKTVEPHGGTSLAAIGAQGMSAYRIHVDV